MNSPYNLRRERNPSPDLIAFPPQASNWTPSGHNELLMSGTRLILISMLGYFLSDLVAIAPEWKKHKVRICAAAAAYCSGFGLMAGCLAP